MSPFSRKKVYGGEISRLQQEAEQYKADLKGTESPTSRSAVRPPS
jgi:hypothetical protein